MSSGSPPGNRDKDKSKRGYRAWSVIFELTVFESAEDVVFIAEAGKQSVILYVAHVIPIAQLINVGGH